MKLITVLHAVCSSCSYRRCWQKLGVGCPSQSRLDPAGESPEVGDSLQFVVWELDIEMVLEPSEQFQRLQAVNPECFEEVVIGSELLTWDLELRRRKAEDFVQRLFTVCHCFISILVERGQG